MAALTNSTGDGHHNVGLEQFCLALLGGVFYETVRPVDLSRGGKYVPVN